MAERVRMLATLRTRVPIPSTYIGQGHEYICEEQLQKDQEGCWGLLATSSTFNETLCHHKRVMKDIQCHPWMSYRSTLS